MSIYADRKKHGCICHNCKSPDYSYIGRVEMPDNNGKHEFKCNSCGTIWQFGKGDSDYLRLSHVKPKN